MKTLLLALVGGLLGIVSAKAAPETVMSLTSGDFPNGGNIPSRFTCDGANISPNLRIDNVPANTKSLALLMTDQDAPGGTFTHWIAWNIAPDTKEFLAGNLPGGIAEGVNDFGKPGYGGPCPPSGVHRYTFHLYALDFVPKFNPRVRRIDFEQALKGHILGETTLIGRYSHGPEAK